MLALGQAGPAGSVVMDTGVSAEERQSLLLKRPALGLPSLLPGLLHTVAGAGGLMHCLL